MPEITDATKWPQGKYRGVRIGLIPTPLLSAELQFGKTLRKRVNKDLKDFIIKKLYGDEKGGINPADTSIEQSALDNQDGGDHS